MNEILSKDMLREATQLYEAGRLVDAALLYKQVVETDSDNVDALYGWACVAYDRENFRNAELLLNRLLSVAGEHAGALVKLGNVHAQTRRPGLAKRAFERALACDDCYLPAYEGLSLFLVDTVADPWEAEKIARQGLAKDKNHAFLRQVLAKALHMQGRSDEAVTLYEQDIKLRPGFKAENLCNLAAVAVDRGDKTKAEKYFVESMKLKPSYVEAHRQYAFIHRYKPGDPHLRQLQNLLANTEKAAIEGAQLNFALGKAFESIRKCDKAFFHFSQGNEIVRSGFEYDLKAREKYDANIRKAYGGDLRGKAILPRKSDIVPIFIVGMPRSGTTLVEQILLAHPQIGAAGEALYLDQLQTKYGLWDFPAYGCDITRIPDGTLIRIRDEYLKKIKRHAPGARYITDKMPTNFAFIGLIRVLFPQAKIITCQRDPMDNCLSIYKEYFRDHVPYAYDLKELGRYYRLYQHFAAFWHITLPGFIHDVQYEELVRDQENVTRRILDFCGLPWDPACLEFYKDDRVVLTASALQVRRPIYTGSIGNWEKYEKHLGPLQEALR